MREHLWELGVTVGTVQPSQENTEGKKEVCVSGQRQGTVGGKERGEASRTEVSHRNTSKGKNQLRILLSVTSGHGNRT